MPSRVTELLGPRGTTIYVQYDDEVAAGLQAVSVTDDIVERTKRYRDSVESIVQEYATLLLSSVEKTASQMKRPTKIGLEFGIQIGGEAGIPLVSKGTTQANIKVSLEWVL